jgi:hypothetical protein
MAALYIDYARTIWTADDVKNVFNDVLSEDIVSSVEECVQTGQDGLPFKRYIVHFLRSNYLLGQWFARINVDGFLIFPIDKPDYVKKGAERYWKLLPVLTEQAHVG